jgi:acetyl esterase/lipase
VVNALRIAAWGALLGVTGLLVHGEVDRDPLPAGIRADTDLVYRRAGGHALRLDVYSPADPARPGGRRRPAVLAIHGGGWRGGSKRVYGRMAAQLARHGYVVAAVDYTLSAPGSPSWPANLDDLREAVRWLRRHAEDYAIDPDRIAAVGASAGGHLAALLATAPAGADASDPTSARVQAVVDFYGPTDLPALVQRSAPAGVSVGLYLGGGPRDVPDRYAAASPALHVIQDTPPVLMIHGDGDRLVPVDQSRRLAAALGTAGVPHRLLVVPGARHGFDFQVGERDLLPDILAFLDSAWNVSSGEKQPTTRRPG